MGCVLGGACRFCCCGAKVEGESRSVMDIYGVLVKVEYPVLEPSDLVHRLYRLVKYPDIAPFIERNHNKTDDWWRRAIIKLRGHMLYTEWRLLY